MKIDRLMGIVVYLLNNGKTPAARLAAEFEVSPRTIMRDMESICKAGIPVQSLPGADGGYRIMEDFVLERNVATRDDYGWIVAALRGLASAYADKTVARTLSKIEGLADGNVLVDIDLSVAREDARVNSLLPLLEGAVSGKCVIFFRYTNSRGETKDVHLEPTGLKYKWYSWYLTGYNTKYGETRMYKLVRMDNVQITDEIFIPRDEALPTDDEKPSSPALHVCLRCQSSIRHLCREYLNGRITREYANGDFEFCFSAPEHESFWFGMLLSFGSRATVLEPLEHRERILKVCREVMDNYEH